MEGAGSQGRSQRFRRGIACPGGRRRLRAGRLIFSSFDGRKLCVARDSMRATFLRELSFPTPEKADGAGVETPLNSRVAIKSVTASPLKPIESKKYGQPRIRLDPARRQWPAARRRRADRDRVLRVVVLDDRPVQSVRPRKVQDGDHPRHAGEQDLRSGVGKAGEWSAAGGGEKVHRARQSNTQARIGPGKAC